MKKLNIALMAGGDSPEREVSLGSAAQVYDALDKDKYNVWLIDVRGRDWTCRTGGGCGLEVDRNDFSLTADGVKTAFDYALIMIHGTPGEDGRLQGYFDFMHIPYSTCGMVSTVVTFDKQLCKQTVAAAGVPVAKGVYIRKGAELGAEEIAEVIGAMPWFVKPNASGSSFGVSKIHTPDEVCAAIDNALAESDGALVEECLLGREVACGLIVKADGEECVFPLTEIISKNEFFDYEAKYTEGFSNEITPAEIDGAAAEKIREYAVRAYKACACRGLVRVDFMLSAGGDPVMIEINSVPGMSAGSIVPKQAACAGISLGELFDTVIKETYTPDNA